MWVFLAVALARCQLSKEQFLSEILLYGLALHGPVEKNDFICVWIDTLRRVPSGMWLELS
jgi:hypothetical protein